jgi:hypothetical protein
MYAGGGVKIQEKMYDFFKILKKVQMYFYQIVLFLTGCFYIIL